MHTILFQLPLVPNKISLQFHTYNGRGWMSWMSGGTTYSSTVRLGSVGWYSWGGEKYAGDFRFCIAINAWRISWCFRSLYIAAILWNNIQDILWSHCEARVLLKLDTFTKLVRPLNFWSSCSSSVLFTCLINSQKYLLSPHQDLRVVKTFATTLQEYYNQRVDHSHPQYWLIQLSMTPCLH